MVSNDSNVYNSFYEFFQSWVSKAYNMWAPQRESKISEELKDQVDPSHDDSTYPMASKELSPGVWVVEEELEWTSLDRPEAALFQQPAQDMAADLREKLQTPEKLRLLLVGKSGGGKSATGNSILGREAFESKLSSRPVTQTFQRASRAWGGKELEVTDTPDILSVGAWWDWGVQGPWAAFDHRAPGPHAVLLVTQLGRFTQEDLEVVRRLEKVFGERILARTVLVFTRKEDLEGGSLDEYLRETDSQDLAKLDVLCSRRHCGFNNRLGPAAQEEQLMKLMENIDMLLFEHEGRPYSSEA